MSTCALSVIVPAYNNPGDLDSCLAALIAEGVPNTEIIVVDDASATAVEPIAAARHVKFLRLVRNAGPSSARNAGAKLATGRILMFVDSDVVVGPGSIRRLLESFDRDATVSAIFGSYDNRPRADGLVSQYRNLLHHYVHQTGSTEASTFWAGCGAIRRVVFEQVGGFDEKRYARCMEDIELGYRLRRAGHRIVLDKTIQVTHLKQWTVRSIVRTDVNCRAIPWTRLILEHQTVADDLNLKGGQRASVALVGFACAGLVLSVIRPWALAIVVAALAGVVVLNRRLYGFFLKERGLRFTCGAVPLHLFYFLYCGLAYVYAWCQFRLESLGLLRTGFSETRF